MPRIVSLFAILLVYLFAPFLIVVDARLIGYWAFEKEDELGKDLSPLRNHGEPSGQSGLLSGRGREKLAVVCCWRMDRNLGLKFPTMIV